MKKVRNAIRKIDGRIVILNLEEVKDGKGSVIFLSLLVPFFTGEAMLEELEFKILEAAKKATGSSCVISMRRELAA